MLLATILLGSTNAIGQSQRFILAEEFTQASCGPCASQNPGFNALLNANDTKIIGLKYQVWWPGYDPMYEHNEPDVDIRVPYYGVTGVPRGYVDGAIITGGSYTGAVNGLTQSEVNARYAVPSPFEIDVTHTYNVDYTEMTINVDITCTQAVSGNLRGHVVVMEKEINFPNPPGSNGESDFYGVMKKMLPTAQGTTLPSAWTAGMTQNLNFIVDVPWYTYNLNELAVVAFIQDNSNKTIHQTGLSLPTLNLPNNVDMAVLGASGVPAVTCAGPFSPTVVIRNEGSAQITSADIIYQVDNYTPQVFNWTGSLNQGQTDIVSLPAVTAPNGEHTIQFTIGNLSAGVDVSPINNFAEKSYISYANFTTIPVVEGFVSTTFPPLDWTIVDLNQDNDTWTRSTAAGGFGNSPESAKMDFFNSANGRVDELVVPKIDLSNVSGNTATLNFNMAHIRKASIALGASDRLEIIVSNDCGVTWTNVFQKTGATLTTNPGVTQTTPYTPAANEWRAETVDLTQFIGMSDVIVKFKARSNNGNNLYIDDINIDITTGINENYLSNAVSVYPTISTGIVNVDIKLESNTDVNFVVFDMMGRMVYSITEKDVSERSFNMDLSNLANGQYSVKIFTDDATTYSNISIAK